jgi:penicillin-binding protein 2
MPFSENRFFVTGLIPAAIFLIIIVRLFYLQIVRGDFYLERSQSNFIQERPISHSRGMVFDQSGVALIDNRPAHDLYVTFALLPDNRKTLKQIAQLMALSSSKIKELDLELKQALQVKDSRSIVLGSLKSKELCSKIEKVVEKESIEGVHVGFATLDIPYRCQISVKALQLPSKETAFENLRELLEFNKEDFFVYVAKAEKKAKGLGQFKPVLFMTDIPFEAYARIEGAISLGLLPGVAIFDSVKRRYIYDNMASHALGYLNEVSAKELREKINYRPGQRIGRKGIEKIYETELRGQDGVERYVVDAKGRRFGEIWEQALLGDDRIQASMPGHGLILSLDYELQAAAERAFLGQAGSVIALEVGTGFILAMASFPNYNPNKIVARDNQKILSSMAKDPLKPWINKVVQEHYAPGSTFKAITAVAGFEHHLLTPQTHQNCSGAFYLGRTSWRCFKREGHGRIEVVEALKTSCDSFFYNLGYQLGPDRLAITAKLLGFGRKTGVDLDMEIPGIMPDREFYKKRLGYYAPGFVVNNSIGQGEVTVTPIQLAVAYDAILNGGTIYKPQLVREIIDIQGKRVSVQKSITLAHLKESEKNLRLVKEGLAYVTQPGGTASSLLWRYDLPELSKWLRESGVVIGGKTGTAQVVKLSKSIKHLDPTKVSYMQRDHAWFIGFAPVQNPEIVVVTMTEHGGFGGTSSAPVVAEIIKTWYQKVRGKGRYAHIGESLVK